MKKKYIPLKIDIVESYERLMYNEAGKEEGMLTESWAGGTPTNGEDYNDSDSAKEIWGTVWDDFEEEEEEY